MMIDPEEQPAESDSKDKRSFVIGLIYSIAIIIILAIVLLYLQADEDAKDDEDDIKDADITINLDDFQNFFFNDSPHYPNGSVSVSSDRCLLCHAGTGTEIKYELDEFKIYNTTRTDTAGKCFVCHVESKHDVESPYNICTDCHYRSDHEALSLSFTHLVKRDGKIDNSFCDSCHKDECTELIRCEHLPNSICTDCHNDHDIIPGCMDCHEPDSIGPYHEYGSPEFVYCTACHKGGAHTRPVINDEMNCSICHTDYYERTLEKYGGRHFTNATLGKCSSCHTEHKEYPDCRDCHGVFPDHLLDTAVQNPNQDCRVCHNGGAHDSRVTYSNYSPDLGDAICQVCHQKEYNVYYNRSTPGEREIYGNCLNCHDDHNVEIKIPHITPDEYLDCSQCHEGYDGPKTMHNIKNTSYQSFPFKIIPDEFCSSCHSDEYNAYDNSPKGYLDYYGNCTDCHNDHKLMDYPHSASSPYNNCADCHTTYNDNISIHDPLNITYDQFQSSIENPFCSACHTTQFDALALASHDSRACTDCHSKHRKISVDFSLCTTCHTTLPPNPNHDETLIDCQKCHDMTKIHGLGP